MTINNSRQSFAVPRDALSDISKVLEIEGVFYVEVPLDGFKTRNFHSTDLYLKYLHFLSRRIRAFILLDFLALIQVESYRLFPRPFV